MLPFLGGLFVMSALGGPSTISIECESRDRQSYLLKTELPGTDPRDHLNRSVQVKWQGRTLQGSVFNTAVDLYGKRLFLEVVLDSERTPETDRVLVVMASWLGDAGDFVYADGVLVDSIYHHAAGRVIEGPQVKIQCSVDIQRSSAF